MAQQPNMEGQQLGNYRLEKLLGMGGFAVVYLGLHVRLKRPAAIKILHTMHSEREIDDFEKEAQIIAALNHPNIVRILEFDVHQQNNQSIPFLVMDYLPHGTLRQRHQRGERVALPTVISYVQQIASALQYAHDQRLIHRDIKPENLLIGWNNEIVLSDFGVAAIAHSTSSMTAEAAIGTAPYMAPEQIQAQARTSSDQYALGIVVYEWLSGERPFEGSLTEIWAKHVMVPPPPLRTKVPEIPEAVEAVILRALEKDPHQRFPNVQDFATALAEAALPRQTSPRIVVAETPLPQSAEFAAASTQAPIIPERSLSQQPVPVVQASAENNIPVAASPSSSGVVSNRAQMAPSIITKPPSVQIPPSPGDLTEVSEEHILYTPDLLAASKITKPPAFTAPDANAVTAISAFATPDANEITALSEFASSDANEITAISAFEHKAFSPVETPITQVPQSLRRPRRKLGVWFLALVCLLILAGGGGVYLLANPALLHTTQTVATPTTLSRSNTTTSGTSIATNPAGQVTATAGGGTATTTTVKTGTPYQVQVPGPCAPSSAPDAVWTLSSSGGYNYTCLADSMQFSTSGAGSFVSTAFSRTPFPENYTASVAISNLSNTGSLAFLMQQTGKEEFGIYINRDNSSPWEACSSEANASNLSCSDSGNITVSANMSLTMKMLDNVFTLSLNGKDIATFSTSGGTKDIEISLTTNHAGGSAQENIQNFVFTPILN